MVLISFTDPYYFDGSSTYQVDKNSSTILLIHQMKKAMRINLKLQFPVRCLDRLLTVLGLFCALTLPS
jgi:hypothetical protein